MDNIRTEMANEIHAKLGALNFKCFVGALRWGKFFQLYRSRTSRYEKAYPDDIYFYFSIQDNDVNWFINETSFQECDCPEISYPEAVRRISEVPEYPKECKIHLLLAYMKKKGR